MPTTRRLEQPIPACRAKMDLLKWAEKYLKQKAADISGNHLYGIDYVVTVQDSWGSLEVFSVEEISQPIARDVERIRLSLSCYETYDDPYQRGQEYFNVSITFANNPALAVCQMRLTGDTSVTLVNGMWTDISKKVLDFPVKGFVQRFRDKWLIAFLFVGLILSVGTAFLFAFHLLNWATIVLAGSIFTLIYAACSWSMPHCVFDSADNEHRLDWNKRFWWAVFTSVGIAGAVRVALKLGFDL